MRSLFVGLLLWWFPVYGMLIRPNTRPSVDSTAPLAVTIFTPAAMGPYGTLAACVEALNALQAVQLPPPADVTTHTEIVAGPCRRPADDFEPGRGVVP